MIVSFISICIICVLTHSNTGELASIFMCEFLCAVFVSEGNFLGCVESKKTPNSLVFKRGLKCLSNVERMKTLQK